MAGGQDTKSYVPGYIPAASSASIPILLSFLQREFRHISQAFAGIWDMPVRSAPPDKLKIGRLVYADGTNWNPGSGEGVYVYTSGGWAKL